MSRKFNTKKFIKDVLNDRYALVIGNEIILNTKIEPSKHQQTAIQSVTEVLLGLSSVQSWRWQAPGTLCCLSKARSRQRYG